MDDSIEIKETTKRAATAELASTLVELVEILLTDVAAEVEVVARELGQDEGRERLRRALDRLGCARGVVEAMREGQGPVEANGEDDHERPGDCAEHYRPVLERVRGALELLAEGWPQDYPDGAVEWLFI
ncbi:hypothetical protein [Caballeronia telluris]|uniref:Uncharacterized protein n=1 Tax=Caballeronia telluris TaxID=326475 RepID=A0A158KDN4_9BURK|nr:hypothetical protein [Caballeronia telluris]SAL78843.1 hypothetical protein AWB66_05927 [Caballeronia telluris]